MSVSLALLTISDSRNTKTDEGGRILRAGLESAGFVATRVDIVPDDPIAIARFVTEACATPGLDAVITTGGTGISPRDQSYEAIAPLLEKTLDGFGEAFRRLSWDEVGPRSVLSRALAGTRNGRVVIALPGSPKAVQLALDRLILPLLVHAVAMAKGESHGHGRPEDKSHAHTR